MEREAGRDLRDSTTPTPAPMLVDYVRYYTAAAGTPPNLGTPNAITVKAGATTANTSVVNLTGTSANGRVYLNCTTNAPKASCAILTTDTLNKVTVNFASSNTATATVTLTTTANSERTGTSAANHHSNGLITRMASFLLVGIVAIGFGRTKKFGGSSLSVFALVLLLTVGCGGGSTGSTGGGGTGGGGNTNTGTAPGTYTVTVNAFAETNTSTTNPPTPDASVTIPITVQ